VALLAALFPAGFFALAWRERFTRLASELRALSYCLKDRELPLRIAQKRRELARELAALAREVPEEWPG
jgi:hypothetical protein